MSWTLAGRTALVTGASAGIGAAMVRALVRAGCRVAATARRPDRLEALARECGEDRVLAVSGDLADAGDRKHIVDSTRARFGPIELLVNNAGYGQRGPVELVMEADARRQFDVNVFALTELTRLVLPEMRAAGRGRILNVSSVVGRVAIPMSGWYAATKHALEALSDALRNEVAPFGIDVVVIEPGPIVTEFQEVAELTLERLEGDVAGYRPMIDDLHAARKDNMLGWMSAADCAEIMLGAAAAPKPWARYPITRLAWAMIFAHWLLPTRVLDWILSRRLKLPPYGSLSRRGRNQ